MCTSNRDFLESWDGSETDSLSANRADSDPIPQGSPQPSVDTRLGRNAPAVDPHPMTEPAPLADCLAEFAQHILAMSQADGCPIQGCQNVEPSNHWEPTRPGYYRTTHTCSDCGHTWTTDWKE